MRSMKSPRKPSDSPRAGAGLVRLFGGLLGGVLFWMPVWVPLVLLAQVGLLGLRPARTESRQIAEHEIERAKRLKGHSERRATLEAWSEALDDPVYRERMQRLLDGR
jgi:hypothetical protein